MVSDSLNSSLKKLRHHSDALFFHELQSNVFSDHADQMYVQQSLHADDGYASSANARDPSTPSFSNETSARPAHTHKEEGEGTRRASATQEVVMRSSTASQAGTCTSSRHGHVASAFPMALLHTHTPKKFWCHSTASAMFLPYLLRQVTWWS